MNLVYRLTYNGDGRFVQKRAEATLACRNNAKSTDGGRSKIFGRQEVELCRVAPAHGGCLVAVIADRVIAAIAWGAISELQGAYHMTSLSPANL